MKLASFFIISLALHLTGMLVYPVSYPKYPPLRFVPVTILSVGEGDGNGEILGPASAKAGAKSRAMSEPKTAKTQARRSLASRKTVARRQTIEIPAEVAANGAAFSDPAPPTAPATEPTSSVINRNNMAIGAADTETDSHIGTLTSGGLGVAKQDGGDGVVGWSTGAGRQGAGNGNGIGVWAPPVSHTPASFRHTPAPAYPEVARRNGKEGRVLLRVLVDEEGKSKLVEINLSSGSRVLDQAAADAIKRWRFAPARLGAMPTASWVKIPVDFRLSD